MASHSIKEQALRVMRLVGAASCRCPAHSQAFAPGVRPESSAAKEHIEPEYAFEVASSTISMAKESLEKLAWISKTMA